MTACTSPGCIADVPCRQHPVQVEPPMAKIRRLEAGSAADARSIARLTAERDTERNANAQLQKYIDEAKAACGDDRVSGQPLADVIRELKAERSLAWDRLEPGLGIDLADAMLQHIATEREACAKVALQSFVVVIDNPDEDFGSCLQRDIAAAIRARGSK